MSRERGGDGERWGEGEGGEGERGRERGRGGERERETYVESCMGKGCMLMLTPHQQLT
jgi:hypothetical protein